jgi:RNA 3'-terminal phosphate cyclase (ATP)
MITMITIDGSMGEGGGQILRTSLALSLVTGEPVRLQRIRAGRKKPGLRRQHLTCVQAAAEVGGARVEGDALGSMELTFRPSTVRPGQYSFAVGTAGSATLVFQTVLPALLVADAPSALVLKGGTHNPMAPPFDFLARSFLPLVDRMGAQVEASLTRPGFYPAGGGRFEVRVTPAPMGRLAPLHLRDRGEPRTRQATALVSRLPRHIGERELARVGTQLGWPDSELAVELVPDPRGPGNALLCALEYEHVTAVFSGFGEKGVRAERVADGVVARVERYLQSSAPVCRHLADQLLIPMALAAGGAFRTLELTDHTTTNLDVIQRFVNTRFTTERRDRDDVEVMAT